MGPARCRDVRNLLRIYLHGHDSDLSEGIGDVEKYDDFLLESPGIVASRVYNHCHESGFRPDVSCTDRSTGETWLVVTLNW